MTRYIMNLKCWINNLCYQWCWW